MANSKSSEPSATEIELKRRGRRRLIGAATLGLLAIVFLPMIFDSEPRRDKQATQEISVQVPAREGQAPLATPTAPPTTAMNPPTLVATAPAAPSTNASPNTVPASGTAINAGSTPPAPTPAPPPAKATGAAPAQATAQTKASTPAIASTPKEEPKTAAAVKKNDMATSKPAEVKGGFAVQIGAFRDADNAQQIVARMKEAKLPVKTDSIATSGGKVTRVRVGPYTSRDDANAALAQIKLAGADGKVVPLK
jgi:DedD protein